MFQLPSQTRARLAHPRAEKYSESRSVRGRRWEAVTPRSLWGESHPSNVIPEIGKASAQPLAQAHPLGRPGGHDAGSLALPCSLHPGAARQGRSLRGEVRQIRCEGRAVLSPAAGPTVLRAPSWAPVPPIAAPTGHPLFSQPHVFPASIVLVCAT